MLVFPDINKLKFKRTNISKRGRLYSSTYKKKYEKISKPNNKTSDIIPISQINNNNSHQGKKSKLNNNSSLVLNSENHKKILNKILNNQIKIINPSKEKKKIEKEKIPDLIKYNNKSENKKTFSNVRANYSNLTNIFFNRQIDINKFIKEINSFLLSHNKIFEELQNLINYEIKTNKDSSKYEKFSQLLKSKEIPINKFNYGLIFKCIIKNTFIKSLKKAILNKSLISRKEIKEEYEKQINDIKQYLNLYNKEKKDLANNKNYDPLVISNNYSPLYNKEIFSNKYDKKINLERNKRKMIIIKSNSSDNVFFSLDNYNKNIFNSKHQINDMEKEELDIKDSLQSSHDITPDKEIVDNHIESIIFKRKIDILREKRFRDIIKKQKNIIDAYIKLKEKVKSSENNLIKTNSFFKENIKSFEFLSPKQIKNDNKNEDIINCINNSYKNFKFENSLIKAKINKYIFQEKKSKENELNINALNSYEKGKSCINNINFEKESKINDFELKDNISSLKNSFSQKVLFNKNIFLTKNLLNNNDKENNELNTKLL